MSKGNERRAEILAAVRTVFVRDSYSGVKLTDVAAQAGCSVGTLYMKFRDRDDPLTFKAAWLMDETGNKPAKQEIAAIKVAEPIVALCIVDEVRLAEWTKSLLGATRGPVRLERLGAGQLT